MATNSNIRLTLTSDETDDHSVQVPMPGRITLSAEARDRLLQCSIFCVSEGDTPDEIDWREFEDALVEILFPRRYILGMPR